MSKTKNKTSREVEHLLGENRRLKKEVKQLQRLIEKSITQRFKEPKEEPVSEPVNICQHCNKGELEIFEIIGRVYTTCPVCGDGNKIN